MDDLGSIEVRAMFSNIGSWVAPWQLRCNFLMHAGALRTGSRVLL